MTIHRRPLLYHELAQWWPLMSAPEDYQEEADFYRTHVVAACDIEPSTMLELGSGGGNNASHIKQHLHMTLVDVAPGMLKVSKHINPECEHVCGDMRTVKLNREFDCVFVHDAIGYMTTQRDLKLAIQNAFVHCRGGGAALFAPDHTRETFRDGTSHGGHDAKNRALRYLEWTWDPDPSDETCVADCVYVLRDADGRVEIRSERHVEGLFTQADWMRILSEVGFEPTMVPFEHSELPEDEFCVFIGKKPTGE